MSKQKNSFICQECGAECAKWSGKCLVCGSWNSLIENEVVEIGLTAPDNEKIQLKKLSQLDETIPPRFSSGFKEFDRVLGGSGQNKKGFVKGQVVLLSGEPGVGKSTLLLQLISNSTREGMKCVYVSSEESDTQLAQRASRLFKIRGNGKSRVLQNEIKVLSGHCVENIIGVLQKKKLEFVIIDSIQTIYSSESSSIPGSISQVKICAYKLTNYAKKRGVTMVIVGHINKEGSIAGPKVLEHVVDSVFQLEGEKKSGVRVLRSLKNRFGPTQEVGLFEMTSRGLVDLKNLVGGYQN